MDSQKPSIEEAVKVDVIDAEGEALKKEAERLLKSFDASELANGYKAGFLGSVVLHAPGLGESLVILKLQAEKHPGDDTDAYAAFMLAHKTSTPVNQLFPLGYKVVNSLAELDMFIANLEFDLSVAGLGVNAASGIA